MRAVDYYEKYKEPLLSSDETAIRKCLFDIVVSLSDEASALTKKRQISRPSGLVAILEEQNQKWNALCHIFEAKHGSSPINKDGFRRFCLVRMPDLKNHFERRTR